MIDHRYMYEVCYIFLAWGGWVIGSAYSQQPGQDPEVGPGGREKRGFS